MNDRNVVIAGAAGEGIQTIGDVVATSFLAHGYPVFLTQEFESRIRGGNSSTTLRIGSAPHNAPRRDADVLLALNRVSQQHYAPQLREGGILISPEVFAFRDLAKEHGGSERYANAVAAGALCAATGMPVAVLERRLRETFAGHGEEVAAANARAAQAGYDQALGRLGERAERPLPPRTHRYAFASAHDAIALGAAAAECRFMAAYPMSPSTHLITTFARHPELGVFAEQAEDEIAAIHMGLGASAAGARAMTATSGGGFALMVEAVSLAGMIETPIVIVLAQRPGPATGLPTRTAQEDLLFAIRAGHGEAPRAVLAPSDPQDALRAAIRAFDLADRYQIPVIVLTDQYLADSRFALPPVELPDAIPGPQLADPASIERYARYRLTDDGVSPRLALGQSEHLVCLDSDEHTEQGHITEDLDTVRPAMVEKRLEKGRRLKGEIAPPSRNAVDDADLVLVGWGSTKGAIDEAVSILRDSGRRVGALHFTELWPLPAMEFSETARYWTAEGNATGQLAQLLRMEYGVETEGRIGRYDGRPLDAATILEALS
ncbi:MAG: 2-oxoacid:acceptor oxidoreductase subunit alpha [Candidatus Bipolaricaulota bacterium]